MATPTTLPATFVAGNVLTAAQMNNLRGAFRVLQVVTTTKTDTFSTAASVFTDITGLSVTITPSSTSSTILVTAAIAPAADAGVAIGYLRLMRDSTAICVGAAAGSRIQATVSPGSVDSNTNFSTAFSFLDSPNTTSATTYKIQGYSNGAGVFYLNRTKTDTDSATFARYASTITVMEISA